MATSEFQKKQIAQCLSQGMTELESAKAAGVSRPTVQRLKRNPEFQKLIQNESIEVTAAALEFQGQAIMTELAAVKEREPMLKAGIWTAFEGVGRLLHGVLEQTEVEDISPRQIPGLAKSMVDLAEAYIGLEDRITGLQTVAHEIQRLGQTRS